MARNPVKQSPKTKYFGGPQIPNKITTPPSVSRVIPVSETNWIRKFGSRQVTMQFPDHSVAFLEENPRLSDTATPLQACGCDVSTSPWNSHLDGSDPSLALDALRRGGQESSGF